MCYDLKQSGGRVRQLRLANGYTQEELARELGIDRSLLSHIEAGKRGCSVDLLVRMSGLFRVSLDYIVLGVAGNDSVDTGKRQRLKMDIELLINHLEAIKGTL